MTNVANMSQRDWLAGMALMGMVAMRPYEHTPATKEEVARECYDMADAMLEASKQ